MTHHQDAAVVAQKLEAAMADLRRLREEHQRVADERDAALEKVAGLEKRARNAESMRDTFASVGVNFAIAASADAERLVQNEHSVAAAAAYAAETHGRDLAVIADALGLPPKDDAQGVRYDAGVIWWRARTVYLLLLRNGLDAAAQANDANVQPGRVTLLGDASEPGAERAGALALCGELARLRAFVDSLGARDVPCKCGSGAHPRECERHPWAYRLHIAEMDAEREDDADMQTLLATIEGSVTPPTDEEIDAHCVDGGGWIWREYTMTSMSSAYSSNHPGHIRRVARRSYSGRRWTRWWSVDRRGIICPRPVVATGDTK